MSEKRSCNELVERILAEMQLSAVADLKPGDREQLRRRLLHLLNESRFPSAEPDRRTVTVLFADIRGFTSLAESYPANVIVGMLNRYLTAMIDIAMRYGGTIDKLMGDAIMVVFGAPTRVMVKSRRAAMTVYELLGTTRPRLLTVPRREIRKSPRVQIEMPCYFQRLSNKTVLPAVHCGQVMDMGYHGMRMLSPVPIESCGEVKMAISLQLLGARTSDIYARAVAISAEADGYHCSMEFTDIDMAGQSTIKQFVDSQISA